MSYTKNNTDETITFKYVVDKIFDAVSMRTLYRAKQIRTEQGGDMTDEYAITEDERPLVLEYVKSASHEILQEVLKITTGVNKAIDISSIKYKDATKITYSSGVDTPFEYEEKITGETSGAVGYVAEDDEALILKRVDGTFQEEETINGESGASATIDTTFVLNTGEILFTIKDKQAYNNNLLDLLDQRIKEGIILYCLSDWYKHCGLAEEYKLAEQNYRQEVIKLNNNLFQLKKPTIA